MSQMYGSDVLAEAMSDLGIKYVALNPGASIRGLHESLVNLGGDSKPCLVTCMHEEVAVAAAHGYAKASGRPMAVLLHNIVGLQHASMAIFNAWVDRVPVLLIGGTGPIAADRRRPWIDWIHTANVQGAQIRDYVKWHDQPASVPAALEALVRAHTFTRSAPCAPVYLCLPVEIQEEPWDGPTMCVAPRDLGRAGPEWSAVARAAKFLAEARSPVIVADRAADSDGAFAALADLAHKIGAAILDRGARMNVATTNPLDLTGDEYNTLRSADVIVAVEVVDLEGTLRIAFAPDAPRPTVIEISQSANLISSWAADYHALAPVDVHIPADAALSLSALASECERRIDAKVAKERRSEIAERHRALRRSWEAKAHAYYETRPVGTAAIALALRDALGDRNYVLSNSTLNGWVRRLWNWEREKTYLGGSGGGGIGYGIGASVGVGLAMRGSDRIVVNLQPDGDLLYAPSALWTMANQRLPVLTVVWNNRGYVNTLQHANAVATSRRRPSPNTVLGHRLEDPGVSFTDLAQAFGVWAAPRVSESKDLLRAVSAALEVVDSGEPALVEVLAADR